jgi:PKD domain
LAVASATPYKNAPLGTPTAPRRSAAVFGSLNQDGLDAEAQVGSAEGASTPPDTTGAIGPADYVEFVNGQVRAYGRTTLTATSAPVGLTEFVGGVAACDPQIKYDPASERWFYAAIRCDSTETANRVYVGFSKTTDPTNFSTAAGGGWCGYTYNSGKALEDYPKLGLDPQHILIGTNSFSAETEAFLTAHILSLSKPASGEITTCPSAATMTAFGSKANPLRTLISGHPAFTPEPATVADQSTGGYVVSADFGTQFGSGENLMIWQVAGTAEAPELTAIAAPTVAAYELPPGVPQPESTDEIDSLDARLTQAVAAADPNAGNEEAVWTQHTVAGGGGSVVRWYELLPESGQVRQAGAISDPNAFVFNGAIAPTLSGNAVINYDTGSRSALVGIAAQSRIGAAPLGTMNTPIELGQSVAVDSDFSCPSQPSGEESAAVTCRWGDYAGASVDPVNPDLVWGSNQLNGPVGSASASGHNPQWKTRNFALEANDAAPSASFTVTPNPSVTGASVVLDASASKDPDGSIASFGWDFGDGSASGSGVSPTHVYATAGSYQVKLTVIDNAGQAGSVIQTVVVNAPSAQVGGGGSGVVLTPIATAPLPVSFVANSAFSIARASINAKTGALTLTTSVADPGTFNWLATFQNGKFGAFGPVSKCKRGLIKLRGKCRPARIAFAKGSKLVAAPAAVNIVLKPSASARKALRSALRQKKGLPVSIVLTFQSARGGRPVSRTFTLTIKLKK